VHSDVTRAADPLAADTLTYLLKDGDSVRSPRVGK